jgi:tetratricopeptide (TPR) repeat protein
MLLVLDVILVVLVLAFAFLVASFPAKNSDVLLDLAAGRLLAHGEYTFGVDPFNFTSEGVYWVNHGWLYDWALYLLHGEPGQTSSTRQALIVILKAGGIALLALLLLLASRRPGQSVWIPATLTALAILVLSPRAFLRSECLSFVLLGLTLWLLVRSEPGGYGGTPASPAMPEHSPRSLWLLPLVFALWVNLDSWFVLGPITVFLYLLGTLVQHQLDQQQASQPPASGGPTPEVGGRKSSRGLARVRTLGIVFLVGLGACLLNPHHVHAFELPSHLGSVATLQAMGEKSGFWSILQSPFHPDQFRLSVALSVAGQAYFLLLLLGLISFGLNYSQVRWDRVFIWLGFALLSGFYARGIPFFAVVAGPITALNFLDFARQRWGLDLPSSSEQQASRGTLASPPTPLGWAVGGRLLTVLGCLALITASLPGWLQHLPYRDRQLGWTFQQDPSLRGVAEQLQTWQEQEPERIGADTRWFSNSHEVTNFFAWYCPGPRGFFDQRLNLFANVAADFEKGRKALWQGNQPQEERPKNPLVPLREVLRKHRVQFVVLYGDASRFTIPLKLLYGNPEEFPVCALHGGAVVYAWQPGGVSPPRETPGSPQRVHFARQAFGPEASQAPAKGPPPPEHRPWWTALWEPEAPRPVSAGTAQQHLARFEALVPRYGRRNYLRATSAIAASLVGNVAGPGSPVVDGSLLPLRMNVTFRLLAQREWVGTPFDRETVRWLERQVTAYDQGPSDSLYLAVRAARRAIAENPQDPLGYLSLARAYLHLSQLTQEQTVTRMLPHARVIRQAQISTALNNVLRLEPSPEVQLQAHELLIELYQNRNFPEMALEHLQQRLDLLRNQGPREGITEKQHKEELAKQEQGVETLRKQINQARKQYDVNTLNKSVLEKAQQALGFGLNKTAQEVLRQAKPEELQHQGIAVGGTILMELLLSTGEPQPVQEGLHPNNAGALGLIQLGPVGLPAYEWLHVQLAATLGNYDEADRYLENMIKQLDPEQGHHEPFRQVDVIGLQDLDKELSFRELAALSVGHYLLQSAPLVTGQAWAVQGFYPFYFQPPYRPRLPLRAPFAGYPQLPGMTGELVFARLSREADLRVLRGWLALERGAIEQAREQIEQVFTLARVGDPRKALLLNFPALGLGRRCLELLNSGKKNGP